MQLRTGLIGLPIAASPSPAMHNAAFAALAIAASYELWPTTSEELPSRIEMVRDDAILGANVTIPHKQQIIPLLDALDTSAALVGAVNTIVKRDGMLYGYNTDARGLLRVIREAQIANPAHVLIIGAGGAARAAIVAASMAGARQITLLARHFEQANKLAQEFQSLIPEIVCEACEESVQCEKIASADIVIQTTPVGSQAQPGIPIRSDLAEQFKQTAVLIDIITQDTPLIHAARARQLTAINGLSMLLYQGAYAFELWTHQQAPIASMRKALTHSTLL